MGRFASVAVRRYASEQQPHKNQQRVQEGDQYGLGPGERQIGEEAFVQMGAPMGRFMDLHGKTGLDGEGTGDPCDGEIDEHGTRIDAGLKAKQKAERKAGFPYRRPSRAVR